jgi:hypothetical protein
MSEEKSLPGVPTRDEVNEMLDKLHAQASWIIDAGLMPSAEKAGDLFLEAASMIASLANRESPSCRLPNDDELRKQADYILPIKHLTPWDSESVKEAYIQYGVKMAKWAWTSVRTRDLGVNITTGDETNLHAKELKLLLECWKGMNTKLQDRIAELEQELAEQKGRGP